MWQLDHPWWEYIFRAGLIYIAVFVLLRVIGKKQIGEMSPFDLVLLLIISESISSAITGGDNSLTAGLIAVTTFIMVNYGMDILMYRSRKLERLLEGKPKLLIVDGVIDRSICEKEKISKGEIFSALREHGLDSVKGVAYGVLETNGQISIVKKDDKKSPPHNPRMDSQI